MTDDLHPRNQFGKLPARKGSISFRFKRYVDLSVVPEAPDEFGSPESYVSHWGLFGNDKFANGVFAGFAQEETLRGRIAGAPVEFTDWGILNDYIAVSGFDFRPDNDRGVDLADASAHRRKVGVTDFLGNLHKVAGYAALKPRSVYELAIAASMFGAVGVGLEISTRALAQFHAGEVWDLTRRGKVIGTTYAPIVGRRENGNFVAVIWGKLQELTPTFYQKYNDESVVYFTEGMLNGETPIEGFKSHLLLKDLRRLNPAGEEGVSGPGVDAAV